MASPRSFPQLQTSSQTMAAKPAYALYNYARSSCSWRARIALEWKGLPYEYVVVDVLGGQQLRDEYAALNPNKVRRWL